MPTKIAFRSRHCSLYAAGAALLLGLAPLARAHAQVKEGFDDRTLPPPPPETHMDTLQEEHTIHVSPHAIVFDAKTRSATVTFSNTGGYQLKGYVQVLFAYPDWPHGLPADTTVISDNMQMLVQRDTVIAKPDAKDHFAGPWISGLPQSLLLKPHETKKVTITIKPPAGLATGEYWARVVAVVSPVDPHKRGGSLDTKERYAMPVKGTVPALRDSVLVVYRQGQLTMGVSFGPGTALRFDSTGYGGPDPRDCPKSLWIKLPMHVTGNTHVDGTLLVEYKNVQTGAIIPVNKFPVSLYRDAVTHWWTHTCWVPVGKYQAILRFEAPQKELPADKRLPMAPIQVTLPTVFEISR